MKCYPTAFTLAASLTLSLAGCGGGVDEAAAESGDGVSASAPGDMPELGSPVPDRMDSFPPPGAALREEAERASADMSWHFKPGWALFGPPEAEGVLTISCGGVGDVARGVVVTRAGPVGAPDTPDADIESGTRGQLRFLGSRESAQVALHAGPSAGHGPVWTGTVRDPEAFVRLFTENEEPMIVTLDDGSGGRVGKDGGRPLAVPPDEHVEDLVADCIGDS